MDTGLTFEKRIEQLYLDLGKKGVEHNVHFRHNGIHSQFDVSYGLRKRYFIECKYRSSGSVQFSEVATFAAKLFLHNSPYKRGIMVTNAYYDTRSKAYAKKRGLKLIDGKKLCSLEKRSLSLWNRLF